jgi:hypothetical protein
LELVASLEFGSLSEAREFERELKRKKNPRLALYALEERRKQITAESSPESFRGWS